MTVQYNFSQAPGYQEAEGGGETCQRRRGAEAKRGKAPHQEREGGGRVEAEGRGGAKKNRGGEATSGPGGGGKETRTRKV